MVSSSSTYFKPFYAIGCCSIVKLSRLCVKGNRPLALLPCQAFASHALAALRIVSQLTTIFRVAHLIQCQVQNPMEHRTGRHRSQKP